MSSPVGLDERVCATSVALRRRGGALPFIYIYIPRSLHIYIYLLIHASIYRSTYMHPSIYLSIYIHLGIYVYLLISRVESI